MPYFAELDENSKVKALIETSVMPNGNFIEVDTYAKSLLGAEWNGDDFILPPAPTHKTRGISAIEWRRFFLADEPFIIDELRDNINNMDYQVPGSPISLDVPAAAIGLAITYRTFLRTCFKAFAEATSGSESKGVDTDDELTYPSLICFEALGILAEGRKEVIIQGVPL